MFLRSASRIPHRYLYKIACFACFYHIKIVQKLSKKQLFHKTFYLTNEMNATCKNILKECESPAQGFNEH